MSTADDLATWRERIEARAAGTERPVARGARRGRRRAADAWFCEGRWQHDEQMDLWQCLDEVELDARAARGDDEDDEDTESEQD